MAADSPIYLDAAATVEASPAVRAAVEAALEDRWHRCPRSAEAAARARAAHALGIPPDRLRWTSGATSANALALRWGSRRLGRTAPRIVSQPTEHPSLLAPLRALEAAGAVTIEWLPVCPDGVVAPAALAQALRRETALVSIMAANHETGVLQPVARLSAICRAAGVPLHVDAAQAPQPWAAAQLADLLSLSAHKLGGPKGVGLLVVPGAAERVHETPPGPAAAVGAAAALEHARSRSQDEFDRLATTRDGLQARILAVVPGALVNGGGAPRLASHLNLSFERVSGDALVLDLALRGIAASSGAACASGAGEPSPVLLALGRDRQHAAGSLRLTLARPLSPAQQERTASALGSAVARLRALAPGD